MNKADGFTDANIRKTVAIKDQRTPSEVKNLNSDYLMIEQRRKEPQAATSCQQMMKSKAKQFFIFISVRRLAKVPGNHHFDYQKVH